MNKDKFIEVLVDSAINESEVLYLANRHGLMRSSLTNHTGIGSFGSANTIEATIQNVSELDLRELPNLVFSALTQAEDTLFIDKLDTAIHRTDACVKIAGKLTVESFETPRYLVERNRLIVDKFFINRHELSDIVSYMGQYIDPITERELILDGYIGNLLNSKILTEANCKPTVIGIGNIYAVADARYLGTVQLSDTAIKYDIQKDNIEISEQLIISLNDYAVAKAVRIDVRDKIAKETVDE